MVLFLRQSTSTSPFSKGGFATVSLFTFKQFLHVQEQLSNWTSKTKHPKGKSKFPSVLFFSVAFCIMEFFFLKAIQDHLHFYEKKKQKTKKVHTTCTRCAFRLTSQVSISSLHSLSPEGGRPAACIMSEMFHATGSLAPHQQTTNTPTHSQLCKRRTFSRYLAVKNRGEDTLHMLLSTVLICGWIHGLQNHPHPPLTPTNAEENPWGFFLNPDTKQTELPDKGSWTKFVF